MTTTEPIALSIMQAALSVGYESPKVILAAIERGDIEAKRLTPSGELRIPVDSLRNWINNLPNTRHEKVAKKSKRKEG